MDLCVETHSSYALPASSLSKPFSGSCSQFPPSGKACPGKCRPSGNHRPYVAPSSVYCSVAISDIVDSLPILSEDIALKYPAPSSDEAQGIELALQDTEYIDRLADKLRECSNMKNCESGEEIYSHIMVCGLDSDRYLGNLLVLMYGNCGCVEEAEAVFHVIPSPNIYSANMMINAYVTSNELEKALIFFESMTQRNRPSWNAIISALAKNGYGKDALTYYHAMLEDGFQPNVITCVSVIDACADAAESVEGMKLHTTVVTNGFDDFIVATALINMYGQCGKLESARYIFHKFSQHDIFSWSAMIAACVNNGCNDEAILMFDDMPNQGLEPSTSTYLSILTACGNLADISRGRQVHAQMLSMDCQVDIKVGNALINMYARCQSLQDSTREFQRMCQRNVITWTTMMAALVWNEKSQDAIKLLYQMQTDYVNPNSHTISIAFDACTKMEALEEGQSIYMDSTRAGIEIDFIAAMALINMYGKCRKLEDAKALFRIFEEHGVLLWNAMISAYAVNNKNIEAWELLEEMQTKGVQPNKATFKIIEDLGPRAFL